MGLFGCSGPDVSVYKDETPVLNIQEYLQGDVEAWGIVEDYSGKVISRFYVLMQADWKGKNGTLKEFFTYEDGTKKQREWKLEMLADGKFRGTAPDVIGEMRGESAGNAAAMQYVLELPVKGSIYRFKFDDRLYQLDAKHVMNRAKMKKFGITVAQMTLFFSKK